MCSLLSICTFNDWFIVQSLDDSINLPVHALQIFLHVLQILLLKP